jgi:hypothetical protein
MKNFKGFSPAIVGVLIALFLGMGFVAYKAGEMQLFSPSEKVNDFNIEVGGDLERIDFEPETPAVSGEWISTPQIFEINNLLYYSEWGIEPYMYGSPAQMAQGNMSQVGWKFALPSGGQITYGGPQSFCQIESFPETTSSACVKSARTDLGGQSLSQADYDALAEFVNQNSALLLQETAEYLVGENWNVDFNPIEGNPPAVEIEQVNPGEYSVTVYISTLDDSVSTLRQIGTATFISTGWELSGPHTQDWRCHPGRGHQEFSTENCI